MSVGFYPAMPFSVAKIYTTSSLENIFIFMNYKKYI
jgi:hypothetical protein